MKKLSIVVLSIALSISVYGQLGSWSIVNIKSTVNDKWALFAEAQIRSLGFYNDFHYYEYKAGGSFNISKTFSALAGFGWYDTYSAGGNFRLPRVNNEFRTWVQISMKQNLNRLKFEHRYRAEQRWTSTGYRNRFRYRLQTIIPLNSTKLQKGTLYTTAWNEIFVTNAAPYFERNRFLLGCGYEIADNFAIQCGLLNQFDYRVNNRSNKLFFQIGFLYELGLSKKKDEHIPGTVE